MLSPLTRLLVAITPLAFAGVLWWLEDGSSRLTGSWFGVAVALLVTAIVFVVRNNAVSDDRAFHRTRPGGDARAVRSTMITILTLVISLALLATLRGMILNLGGRATFWSAFILFTLIGWLAFAVATGVSLAIGRSGQNRRIAIVMLGLPTLVFLWKHPGGHTLPREFDTTFPMLWPFIGTGGYALAWWLITARRRWTPALAVAGIVGVAMPLLGGVPLWTPSLPTLPLSKVVIERLPVETAQSRGTSLEIERQIVARDLGKDEFIGFETLIPSAPTTRTPPIEVTQATDQPGRFGAGSRGLARGILWNRSAPLKSGQVTMLEDLASRLPQPHTLQLTGFQLHQGNWAGPMYWGDSMRPDEFNTDEIKKAVWLPEGAVYRWEYVGEFPASEGGRKKIPSGGSLRIRPMEFRDNRTSISLQVIRPFPAFSDSPLKMGPKLNGLPSVSDLPVLFVRDPITGNVLVPEVNAGREHWGLAAEWENLSAQLGDGEEMTGEERAALRRSTVHVFFPRPLARIAAELPPPR